MVLFAFVTVYLVCAAVLLSAVWQSARRGGGRGGPGDRAGAHAPHDLVFQTHH